MGRELAHPVDYRGDQRERAIQQRLSRHLGKKAYLNTGTTPIQNYNLTYVQTN